MCDWFVVGLIDWLIVVERVGLSWLDWLTDYRSRCGGVPLTDDDREHRTVTELTGAARWLNRCRYLAWSVCARRITVDVGGASDEGGRLFRAVVTWYAASDRPYRGSPR